ncbi:cytochrome P450 [Earliella scabrosa]|nr:cytochrome P450 [Earliella scabrosa]
MIGRNAPMASLVWPPMNALRTPSNLKSTHERHALDTGSSQSMLARSDALIVVISIALLVYLVFKRFEPVHIRHHFGLLLVLPALLAAFVLSPHYAPGRAALIAYAVHFATILTATIVYRASPWHPLARYPGPFIYRLSKLAFAWTASDGKQYVHLHQLHERYGDIVRIGPNEVSLRDAAAIVPLLGPNGLPKGPHWAGRNMTDSAQQLVSLVDIREHARRRRPWNRAFSTAALKGYEEILAPRVEQLVELLATHDSEDRPVDLGKCVGSFTYDFMSDMVFGGGSEMMRDGDKDSVWHLMEQGLAASQVMGHCPWLGIYMGYVPFAAQLMKKLLDYGEEQALKRIGNGSLSRDLFYYLNNEDGSETSAPPLPQVAIDGALAIVAGSDTTSCVLANTFYCLMSNPDVYKRLQAEVDTTFPPGENAMDTSKHPDMPYLNAVINETMRVYPPLPSGSQRATTRETGGIMAGPYYIPPETTVNLPFYSLHRDPRNFSPCPDTFWPDRWLIAAGLQKYEGPPGRSRGEGATEFAEFVHNANVAIPFSFGPANCVGKSLAMQEMRTLLCLVTQKLRLRPAQGWDPSTYDGQIREWLVMTKPCLPVVVERRAGKGES